MIDVTTQINAVRRQVGSRTLDAGEARTVTLTQTYDAPIDDVWDACTSAERIPRWFLPISGDLRLGGHYQLEGQAGGTVQQCDPPKSFAATWEFGGEVSWIEVRLDPAPSGGTRLEIEHIAPLDQQRWAEFGPGAVGIGWDSIIMGLALHLTSGGTALDPAEVATWVASEQGREFMAASSRGWCDASIAGGTDPTEARAAADRVTAAYTGAPAPAAAPPAAEPPATEPPEGATAPHPGR
ncbi:SRPBCC family protein [Rugosimonospora acidiphila]|uniref:SRPBCC family protein n=1 Tax=Rugosimonospora acidiphila TaxID=556531 RepID=A0ABP9SQU8_9ACTN